MKLAIITARGGSKRIPRKNVRPFCGRPIIAYPIAAALESDCFDEVMVSTDDEEIADVARRHRALVPFYRSAAASNDHAPTAAVIVEVLQEYAKRGKPVDVACCLYPTAPFITAEALRSGLRLLESDARFTGVIPVTRFSYPIQRALRVTNRCVEMFQPEHLSSRSPGPRAGLPRRRSVLLDARSRLHDNAEPDDAADGGIDTARVADAGYR